MVAPPDATGDETESFQSKPKVQRRVLQGRARTGCERCRAQRRKCDEGKPQCQRCANVGVECHYATRFSFLGKNSHTLSSRAFVNKESASAPPLDLVVEPQNEIQNHQRIVQNEPQNDDVGSSSDLALLHGAPSEEKYTLFPLVASKSLSQHESDLLRHYCHHVAPWLDVYDNSRTFGILFPRLAMMSGWVMDGVLQLAAESLDLAISAPEARGVGLLHFMAMSRNTDHEPPLDGLQLVAKFVLIKAKQFYQVVPDTWTAILYSGVPPGVARNDFTDVTHQRMWLLSFALMSRLGIAYALTHEFAPSISSKLLREVLVCLDTHAARPGIFDEVLTSCLRCLALLGEVMVFCLPLREHEPVSTETTLPVSTRISSADNWRTLLDALLDWHTSRPDDLQALTETEDGEATFPTILFTNSAGISANVLYHFAMFMLFSHKPDAVSSNDWHTQTRVDIAQTSHVWHAWRVCGIALNSEPEHSKCWEPCMIAAFSIAAKGIKSEAQRNDIIACLGRVRAAGWRIDSLVTKLREDWRVLDNN